MEFIGNASNVGGDSYQLPDHISSGQFSIHNVVDQSSPMSIDRCEEQSYIDMDKVKKEIDAGCSDRGNHATAAEAYAAAAADTAGDLQTEEDDGAYDFGDDGSRDASPSTLNNDNSYEFVKVEDDIGRGLTNSKPNKRNKKPSVAKKKKAKSNRLPKNERRQIPQCRRHRESFRKYRNLLTAEFFKNNDVKLPYTKVKLSDNFTYDTTILKLSTIDPSDSVSLDTRNAHIMFYNLLIPTTELLHYVRTHVEDIALAPISLDTDIRILSYVADIYSRLMWKHGIHVSCFLKLDWLEKKNFIIFTRQAKQSPPVVKSDMFWTSMYRTSTVVPYDVNLCPKPDLNRSTGYSLSKESNVFIVGYKDPLTIAAMYPSKYLHTKHQYLYKTLCKIVDSINDNVWEDTLYAPMFNDIKVDLLKVYMPEKLCPDISRGSSDNILYMYNFEMFLQMVMKSIMSFKSSAADSGEPIVIHNVNLRKITKSSCQNRVYYYRNSDNYMCAMTVVDDIMDKVKNHEDINEDGSNNTRTVYFYSVIDVNHHINNTGVNESLQFDHKLLLDYREAIDMLNTCPTSNHRLTKTILEARRPPQDDFYNGITISMMDELIDEYSYITMKNYSHKYPTYASRIPEYSDNKRLFDDYVSEDSDDEQYYGNSFMRNERRRLRRLKRTANADTVKVSFKQSDGSLLILNVPVEKMAVDVKYPKRSVRLNSEKLMTPNLTLRYNSECVELDMCIPSGFNSTDKIVKVFKIRYEEDDVFTAVPVLHILFRDLPICKMSESFIQYVKTEIKNVDPPKSYFTNKGVSSYFLDKNIEEFEAPKYAQNIEIDVIRNCNVTPSTDHLNNVCNNESDTRRPTSAHHTNNIFGAGPTGCYGITSSTVPVPPPNERMSPPTPLGIESTDSIEHDAATSAVDSSPHLVTNNVNTDNYNNPCRLRQNMNDFAEFDFSMLSVPAEEIHACTSSDLGTGEILPNENNYTDPDIFGLDLNGFDHTFNDS